MKLRRKKSGGAKKPSIDGVKTAVKDKLSLNEEPAPNQDRVTSQTVEEVREEVLGAARRFIYPLQHSKHRVVIISSALIIGVVAMLFVASGLMLYRFKSTNDFAYRISQIVPFPVARINGNFVAYEDYLFEIRHLLHYYRTHPQEGVDIDSKEGQVLVAESKRQAYQKVKLQALTNQLARERGITVSSEEISAAIDPIKIQAGATQESGETGLNQVLSNYYGWNESDLRKVIKQQIIRQKLLPMLDTATREQAETVLARVKSGADFGDLAKEFSDNQISRAKDGVVGDIARSDTAYPAAFIEAAFNLTQGQASEIIEVPYGLHIVKHLGRKGDKITVAHIQFNYFNLDEYLLSELAKSSVKDYIQL